jgi:hypothetical protein
MMSSSKRKIKRPQAQLNRMKQATPGSIVYSALMVCFMIPMNSKTDAKFQFRHCISALNDWCTEDDLFNRENLSTFLLSLFEDPDNHWAKDTLAWWNKYVLLFPLITS